GRNPIMAELNPTPSASPASRRAWLFAFLLGAIAPGTARAEASLEVIRSLGSGFGRFSVTGFILFGVFLVLLMGGLVLFEILRAGKGQREKIDIGWQYFAEMAGQKRLTGQEVEILKRIVEDGGVSSADMVFDSSFVYEEALEGFLKTNARQLDKEE